MKTIFFSVLLLISVSALSQTFVSDSIRRFSETTNSTIESKSDTSWTIIRSFKYIQILRREYGDRGVKNYGMSESKAFIKIEEKSLAIRKGNTKPQIIRGFLNGMQLATVAYNLIDRNDDGDYECLEFIMRENGDDFIAVYCHLK